VRDTNHNSSDNYSNQQGYGYRRGFVLGLTLAETALLLIFIILMLLVIGFDRRDKALALLQQLQLVITTQVPAGQEPIQYVKSQLELVKQLHEAALQSGQEWDEDFIQLVRAVASSGKNADIAGLTKALEEKLAQLEQILKLAGDIKNPEHVKDLIEKMAELESTNQNQRGQLAELRTRLGKLGLGNQFPSCWSTSEGGTEYIMDVGLISEGIRVRETIPERRIEERSRLPLPPVDTTQIYTQNEFLTLTKDLYDWSIVNECRFYVFVYDGTADHEKQLYKNQLKTVEGHFYKNFNVPDLTDAAIPF
jgi:hypothetical protein